MPFVASNAAKPEGFKSRAIAPGKQHAAKVRRASSNAQFVMPVPSRLKRQPQSRVAADLTQEILSAPYRPVDGLFVHVIEAAVGP